MAKQHQFPIMTETNDHANCMKQNRSLVGVGRTQSTAALCLVAAASVNVTYCSIFSMNESLSVSKVMVSVSCLNIAVCPASASSCPTSIKHSADWYSISVKPVWGYLMTPDSVWSDPSVTILSAYLMTTWNTHSVCSAWSRDVCLVVGVWWSVIVCRFDRHRHNNCDAVTRGQWLHAFKQ